MSYKLKTRSLKFLILSFTLLALSFTLNCSAQEIDILYSGETHAMLYPCDCPRQSDGGIARRAALIKELRKKNPNSLVLDSGNFFASGLRDEYTQNTQLDSGRSLINLKAMELMQYDAVAIGEDEFNFGKDFLAGHITKYNLGFLSSNLKLEGIRPYLIKEIAGIKIGIIGATTLFAKEKAGELNFIEPKIAVSKAVEELKKEKIDLIVLLSNLGENEDLKLIAEVKGIDIVISGRIRNKDDAFTKVGSSLILRPSWQGRYLGKAALKIENKQITDCKVEEMRLSNEVSDSADILSLLPECFSDRNCRREGYSPGKCENPGGTGARCLFSTATKINLLVITPKSCRTCNTEETIRILRRYLPGLEVSYLYYPAGRAKKIIKKFSLSSLPAYLLAKKVEKERAFVDLNLKDNAEIKGKFYLLKPHFSGVAYFLQRQEEKGKLDLFISLYDDSAEALLATLKGFNPDLHFLIREEESGFNAGQGKPEVEECLRLVCVKKYYPEYFWNYMSCRAKNINSSWWDDCASGLEIAKIKACAQGEEGAALLRENIALNNELEIRRGPTYLLDNQEIFGSKGAPSQEEFKKILKD